MVHPVSIHIVGQCCSIGMDSVGEGAEDGIHRGQGGHRKELEKLGEEEEQRGQRSNRETASKTITSSCAPKPGEEW